MTVLAIDIGGGGSRWCTADGRRGRGPALSVGAHGIDVGVILAEIARGVRDSTGRAPRRVVLGMSGVLGLVDGAGSVHDALRRHWPDASTVVCSDAVTALVGALGLHGGVVVAAGTGVIALGSDLHHVWRRADGWGHLLGDQGGGAWIGVHGLQAALRAHDGRAGGSPALRSAAMRRYGELEGLPRQIYTRDDRARLLAAFVPDVVEAAEEDPVAREILRAAGTHLAEAAIAVSGTDIPRRCALTGGIAHLGGEVVDAFAVRIREAEMVLVPPGGEPLDGALRIGVALTQNREAVSEWPPLVTKEER
ncbi:MAG: BadF/BadG/BcrA/BcrD ATPase family protein [Microbacterium sp.]